MVSPSIAKHLTILLCICCMASGVCQNLVRNPSFEEFVNCPKELGNFNDDVPHWSTPTDGSTDYFNNCSETATMGAPKNFNGTQPADFGEGYAGLYLYAPGDYREYLQGELSQPLAKGKKYRVSFYVSLAERSDFAVKEFGILFSKDKMEIPGKKELSAKKRYQQKGNDYNYMEIGYTNFYSDTKDWVLVYTQFEAKGTERYMTLGNFKRNARTRLFKTKKNAKQGAYYYVDMVLVEDAYQTSTAYNRTTLKDNDQTFELDKVHVFENLLFAFDRFELRPEAKEEMQLLFEYMRKDPTLQIAVIGHTDSVGSTTYNTWLSSKRAEAVAGYLQKLGLEKDKIDWQGHGGAKPIATNDTEKGRQLNRRVEFVITKNSL